MLLYHTRLLYLYRCPSLSSCVMCIHLALIRRLIFPIHQQFMLLLALQLFCFYIFLIFFFKFCPWTNLFVNKKHTSDEYVSMLTLLLT